MSCIVSNMSMRGDWFACKQPILIVCWVRGVLNSVDFGGAGEERVSIFITMQRIGVNYVRRPRCRFVR